MPDAVNRGGKARFSTISTTEACRAGVSKVLMMPCAICSRNQPACSDARDSRAHQRYGLAAELSLPPRRRASVSHLQEEVREDAMIRKLKSGEYRLYSRKRDPKSGKRRNLGTFANREAALKHERAVQYFKRR